jgi:glucose-6-phosphate 1-dehydrogenase
VDFGPGQLLAYGEVLEGILDGDPSLSVRGDTAVECWRIVAPVVTEWRKNEVALDVYRAGSLGPASWLPLG